MVRGRLADPSTTRRTTWLALLSGVVVFAVADAALFRSGLYGFGAKPDSSGGWVALRALIDPALLPAPAAPSVYLVGDSRMADGCGAELVQAAIGEPRVTVRDGSMPGSTPRVWPFLLRETTDVQAPWTLVVVGLASYDDDAEPEPFADRALDLAFTGQLSRFGDAAEIAASYAAGDSKRDAWLGTLVKSYAWRHDQRDLLARPLQRYLDVRWQLGSRRRSVYTGQEGSLAGVHVDGDRIAGVPPGSEAMAPLLHELVWPSRAACDNTEYRRQWLGRLVDAAAANGSTVVFVRLPTQVLPRAEPRPPRENVLAELRQRPNVRVLARDLGAELERPEFFFDTVHLNRAGRERFSRLLADALVRECGALLGR